MKKMYICLALTPAVSAIVFSADIGGTSIFKFWPVYLLTLILVMVAESLGEE